MLLNPWAEIDRFFADLPTFAPPFRVGDFHLAHEPAWAGYEVRESDQNVQVLVDLPGVTLDHVDVQIEDGQLVIRGERKAEAPEGYELVRRERTAASFERRFVLGRDVVGDDATASFANGVLTVTLPKRPEAKPQRIQVTTDTSQARLEEGKK